MQEVVWKNDEVMSFACALVRHALEKLKVGVTHFTTDIVPDQERGTGHGIAGSVITMLQNAHVIQPVGIKQGEIFYAHRVKSERPGAKARYLGMYQLTSRPLAEEFLARNSVAVDASPLQPNHQPELVTT
jgi:hypothetical protein